MQQRAMDVVVVGGSLAGLLHAIAFNRLGHKVHVLERSSEDTLRSQAAGISVGPDVLKFVKEYITTDKPYTKTSSHLEITNVQGNTINTLPSNNIIHFTSWSLLHSMLLNLLRDDKTDEQPTCQTGKLVQDVKYDQKKVDVTYLDRETGLTKVLQADLVIAADRAHSSIRRSLIPDVQPKYAGYITWWGAVPEASLLDDTRKALQDKVTLLRTDKGYIMSYHIPSDSGCLKPGSCQFIWIWYEVLDENSTEFQDVFTDVTGAKHLATVPRGKIQPKVWAKRQSCAANLSPSFEELISKTKDPFVSAIRDFVSPRSVFHDGKLLLVGDAFALFRPYVDLSINQAVRQARNLADVLQGKGTLAEWEKASVGYAMKTSALSVAMADFYFTGKIPCRVIAAPQPEVSS